MSDPFDRSRFRAPAPEDMSEAQRAVAEKISGGPRGRIPTPYRIWLNSPPLAAHLEAFGRYLLRESALSQRESELSILTVAYCTGADFVTAAHGRIGRQAGLPEEIVDAVSTGRAPAFAEERERVIYELSAAIAGRAPVSNALFERAVQAIGHDGISDLTGLIGYYEAVAAVLKIYDVHAPTS